MAVTYYIKLFHRGADTHNGILMPLLLLVEETKTTEQGHWRRSGVIVNFEHISLFSSVSSVDFEQLNVS